MNNENTIIYPVEEELYPFVEYMYTSVGAKNIFCCVPNQWFTCGKDIILSDDKIINLKDIEYVLNVEKCDKIIIINSKEQIDLENLITPYLRIIKEKKLEINFACPLETKLEILLETENIEYRIIQTKENTHNMNADQRILKIDVPIVFVLGMFKNTEKLKTTLYVHEYLKKKGYNVKTILTKENIININDCYSFPDFMFSTKYTDAEKIIFFNHYIRKIEVKEKPDIIIVGIPGEIMPLNDINNGNFGTMPFLISNSLICDYAILNIYGNFVSKEFVEELKIACKNKYSILVNSVVISDTIVDFASINTKTLKIYRQEQSTIADGFYYKGKDNKGNDLGENIIIELSKINNWEQI